MLRVFSSFYLSSALIKAERVLVEFINLTYFSVVQEGRFIADHFGPLQQLA